MILQRDQPIHIWGKGFPGATVRVGLLKNTTKVGAEPTTISTKTAIVKADSSWSVYLPALPASVTPHELQINSGKTNIRFGNILFGDIWVCIGQSNMEWPMQREMHYSQAKLSAEQPLLRFYNPTYAGKNIFNQYFSDSVLQLLTPEKFYATTQWELSDSNHFKTMSAVAYYYGKEIVQNTKIPIGLINLSIAGAPLETFIGINALKNSSQFAKKAEEPWLTNPALPLWIKERGNQNLKTGTLHPFKPGQAYEAGIKPLFPLAIKGIINYQGESNAQEMERVQEYAALTNLMVNDYRKQWKQPTLPYYYVQLSSIDTAKYKGHFWGAFREEQRRTMDLIPYSGMAVCSDIGFKDNVHPTNKKWVGERLARWALNKTYQKNMLASGPLPTKAVYKNGEVIVYFKYTGKGLQTADAENSNVFASNESKSLQGFSLDGVRPVSASIQGQTVHIAVSSKPDFIYYGWKSYSDGNLYNSEGLPASTFKLSVQ
ncbi:sialate O-acetylesterase [Sediminibacterium sp.]|uniref:sialate O-acetylesterase n=1 Tax=Sediminibacterium sp. TaxID=1917865 RepID=UPI003F69F0A9